MLINEFRLLMVYLYLSVDRSYYALLPWKRWIHRSSAKMKTVVDTDR